MLEFVCILIVRNFKIIFELFSFISFSINFPALSNSSFKHYCKYTGYFYVQYQLCSAHTHTVVLSLLVCTACCIFLRLFVEIYACLFIGCSISFCSSLSPPPATSSMPYTLSLPFTLLFYWKLTHLAQFFWRRVLSFQLNLAPKCMQWFFSALQIWQFGGKAPRLVWQNLRSIINIVFFSTLKQFLY